MPARIETLAQPCIGRGNSKCRRNAEVRLWDTDGKDLGVYCFQCAQILKKHIDHGEMRDRVSQQ